DVVTVSPGTCSANSTPAITERAAFPVHNVTTSTVRNLPLLNRSLASCAYDRVGRILKRLLILGAMPAALFAMPPAAGAEAANATPHTAGPALQAFTGTGTGTQSFGAFIDDVFQNGTYTSTGQLGSGRFGFDEGLNAGATFTRSDGAQLSGTTLVDTPGACGD